MTVHISIRLPWHDRGWDGHVCDDPANNPYCAGLRSVNAERIRTRDLEVERACAGQHLAALAGAAPPPCTETINAFGRQPVDHEHRPPNFIRGAQPILERYEHSSSGTWPYENMWDENSQWRPPEERREAAEEYFSDVEPDRSLAFYYCNYDTPLNGDANRYLIVGVARIKKLSPRLLIWPGAEAESTKRYGDFVWSRRIVNGYPAEGVRLPYQELLRRGMSPEDLANRAVFIGDDLAQRFKYATRRLLPDDATLVLERIISCLRKLIDSGLLDGVPGDHRRGLQWLDTVLEECWLDRGLYPGLAPVLKFLDFREPADFVRTSLASVDPAERRDWLFSRIEGRRAVEPAYVERFAPALQRWQSLDADLQALVRDRLPLFALSEEEVLKSLGSHRERYGIRASFRELADNPYILCEDYIGAQADERISFHRIDHGMRPPLALGGKEPRIDRADGRRLRALIVKTLEAEAASGHSFVEKVRLPELIRDPDPDPADVHSVLLDDARWRQHRDLFVRKVGFEQVDGVDAVYLATLRADETKIRSEVVGLLRDGLADPSGVDWIARLRKLQQNPIEDALGQQARTLETLHRARFAILTGGAGTGKTTVLKALVEALLEAEPGHPVLLLAPTGKAAVLLEQRVGLPARTVHSFLVEQKWIVPPSFHVTREGGARNSGFKTVIVDEGSMIDLTLLASLFRALQTSYLDRLVLVGDPGQLPPIGPGRPFLDIIEYLRKDERRVTDHLAELNYNCRQAQGSRIALLAGHYTRPLERPPEEVLDQLRIGGAEGDLDVRIYPDDDALDVMLPEVLGQAMEEACNEDGVAPVPADLGERFKAAHRLTDWACVDLDRVQILAPYRITVDMLNADVRRMLWGNSLRRAWLHGGLVIHDRVMQTRNVNLEAYDYKDKQTKTRYVPNGATGFVSPIKRADFYRWKKVPVRFGPDYERYKFELFEKQCEAELAFAYALSTHKAQGSQFGTVIAVLPSRDTPFLSRELLYTLLTRPRTKLYLLVERDASIVLSRIWGGHSELLRRNSGLFHTRRGYRIEEMERFKPESLIETELPDLFVRSAQEALIARVLTRCGIPFQYEKPLWARDRQTAKIPDFTFRARRKDLYLEHLGMAGQEDYDRAWKRKLQWYRQNGYESQLLVTPIEGLGLKQSLARILEEQLGVDPPQIAAALA